jgi:hypothetical protein
MEKWKYGDMETWTWKHRCIKIKTEAQATIPPFIRLRGLLIVKTEVCHLSVCRRRNKLSVSKRTKRICPSMDRYLVDKTAYKTVPEKSRVKDDPIDESLAAKIAPCGELATPLLTVKPVGVYSTTFVQYLYISCYLSDNKPVLSYLSSRLLLQW